MSLVPYKMSPYLHEYDSMKTNVTERFKIKRVEVGGVIQQRS